jgi:hypothetical protein
MSELPKELKQRKASEVFLEYCEPLIDDLVDGSQSELKKLEECLKVPWIVWNSIVLDQTKKSKVAWVGSTKMHAKGAPAGDVLIEFWRQRKIKLFDDYRYLMGDFKVIPTAKGAFTLRMESRRPNQN